MDSVTETAENVAAEWGVSPSGQDGFAFRSRQRCRGAIASGCFVTEIAPVSIPGEGVVDREETPAARLPTSSTGATETMIVERV